MAVQKYFDTGLNQWVEILRSADGIEDVIAGTNITIDKTNPLTPVISATGGSSGVASVNGNTGPTVVLTKADLSLGNVDNTSDANKPVSTAQQTALNGKITAVTSTDNAITRFDGIAGQVQNSGVLIDDNSNIVMPDIPTGGNISTGATNGTMLGLTGDKIGFFGTTPVVKPIATVDLITGLSNIGLRTAGTAVPISTSGTSVFSGALTMSGNRRYTPGLITASVTLSSTDTTDRRVTASTAAINITLPATTTAGLTFRFYRTDATAQVVTITGVINGDSGGYVLPNQYSYVEVKSTTTSGAWEVWSDKAYITAGTNVTVTGSGSSSNPYVINATGGGGGGSGITRSITSISTNTTGGTTSATDYYYSCTAALTFTLPTGNSNQYTVKNRSTGNVTVVGTVDGDAGGAIIGAGESMTFIYNGSDWDAN